MAPWRVGARGVQSMPSSPELEPGATTPFLDYSRCRPFPLMPRFGVAHSFARPSARCPDLEPHSSELRVLGLELAPGPRADLSDFVRLVPGSSRSAPKSELTRRDAQLRALSIRLRPEFRATPLLWASLRNDLSQCPRTRADPAELGQTSSAPRIPEQPSGSEAPAGPTEPPRVRASRRLWPRSWPDIPANPSIKPPDAPRMERYDDHGHDHDHDRDHDNDHDHADDTDDTDDDDAFDETRRRWLTFGGARRPFRDGDKARRRVGRCSRSFEADRG